jgi:hypothetical protein
MGEKYEIPVPDAVPETFAITSTNGKVHTFEIEFLLWGHVNSLRAVEVDSDTQYNFHLYNDIHEPFSSAWDRLLAVIEDMINTQYIDDEEEFGYFVDDKAIGYIDGGESPDTPLIFIDGRPYSWEDMQKNVAAHEGWRIKIEFAESEEELL